MELSSAVFQDILSPLAAFKEIRSREGPDGNLPSSGENAPTGSPQSDQTIHTLHPFPTTRSTPKYKWTIQGADPDARRFFAVPEFALDKPPLRIDVYLPSLEDYPPDVREILRPEEVFYSPRADIASLRISRWLAGALEQCENTKGKFQREYESMPFGSRILVTIGGLSNSSGGLTVDHEIHLYHDYGVEQGMLTVDPLREMWGVSLSCWPEVIDLEDLHLKHQFHEAISVVTIDSSLNVSPSHDDNKGSPQVKETEWIFKSLTRDQRYLYNELKMLLSLEPHENIIPKSRYIVTKKGRFGSRKGVCGFVLEYFPDGSLKQFLLDRHGPRASGGISFEQKVLWAQQITRALVHINTDSHANIDALCQHPGDDEVSKWSQWYGFYPDLKPDNIVLRPSEDNHTPISAEGERQRAGVLYDAVLIDLEQRGGWFSWSPPEISHLEYLETPLAANVDELGGKGYDVDALEEVQEENQSQEYYNCDGGFSTPWLALLAKRKAAVGSSANRQAKPFDHDVGAFDLEKAQVFMLGKLLWCIFEEEALMRCGIDHEMLSDRPERVAAKGTESVKGQKVFPEFQDTPEEIRGLIKSCTAGADEWNDAGRGGWRVVLGTDGKLVPASSSGNITAKDTQREATMYWKGEVDKARSFVAGMVDYEKQRRGISVVGSEGNLGSGYEEPPLLKQARSRPTLGQVMEVLERIG
ncbi:hypothetical protein V8F20_001443 [Naviculisporaceae sp. PSN 640]